MSQQIIRTSQVEDANNVSLPILLDTTSNTANQAYTQANLAYAAANSAVANSSTGAFNQANLAYTQANLAYSRANASVVNVSSSNTANLVVSTSGSNVTIDFTRCRFSRSTR